RREIAQQRAPAWMRTRRRCVSSVATCSGELPSPDGSVPLSVPWSNSPSGPRATSWISPGAVAQAPIGQSTGTVVLPSRASGTPREVGGWYSPRSPPITSSSPAGPRQKTVTRRSPLGTATGDETFSAIADQRRGFAIGAMIRQLEADRLARVSFGDALAHGRSVAAPSDTS